MTLNQAGAGNYSRNGYSKRELKAKGYDILITGEMGIETQPRLLRWLPLFWTNL